MHAYIHLVDMTRMWRHMISQHCNICIPMLATLLTNTTITGLSIGLAALQFPLYGAFVAGSGRFRWLGLGVFHGVAIAAAFSGALASFSG